MKSQEVVQVVSVDTQGLDFARRNHRCRPRAVFAKRRLAEEIAFAGRLEHDTPASVVLEKNLDDVRADDVHRIAGVAVGKHHFAFTKADDVELAGEKIALLVVE